MKYFNDVLLLSTKLHYNQTRKDNITPYIVHPFRVSLMVKESLDEALYADYTPVYGALLHDVIEDTYVDFNELNHLLCACTLQMKGNNGNIDGAVANEIVNIVLFLTKEKCKGSNRADINMIYVNQVLSGGYIPVLIKLCDRIDNVRDIATIGNDEFKKLYLRETELLCAEINKWLQENKYSGNNLHNVTEKRLWELLEIVDQSP